jgi:hypothetical protein
MKEQGVGFLANLVSSVGDDFLSNLTSIIFPLNSKVWHALNDAHNRGGVAPEQEFSCFFGRRIYSKKADRPNFTPILQHIQNVRIGAHAICRKGN